MWTALLGSGKSKMFLIILFAVVIIGIFVFIYFIGRRSAKVTIQQATLPTDQPGGYKLTEADNQFIRSTSQSLHDDMKGLNLTHNLTPYQNLMSSNDTVFVAIYNDFNNLFGAENDGTLRDWINGEVGGWWNGVYESLRKSILDRMDRLNLK